MAFVAALEACGCITSCSSVRYSRRRLRKPLLRGSPRLSALHPVSRNVSRWERTQFFYPSGRAHRCLRRRPIHLPCNSKDKLSGQGSPKARQIGDNHSRYCEGRDICMLSHASLDTFCLSLKDSSVLKRSKSDLPVGGRLGYFWQEWEKMGASRRIVWWLKFYLPFVSIA